MTPSADDLARWAWEDAIDGKASPSIRYRRGRDKYGRSEHTAYLDPGYGRPVGVIVKLPTAFTEIHPGCNYLVNHRTVCVDGTDYQHLVTYHGTLAQAKRALEREVRS